PRVARRGRVAARPDSAVVRREGRGALAIVGGARAANHVRPDSRADPRRRHRLRPPDRRPLRGRSDRGTRAGAPRREAMTVVIGTAGHIDHGKTTLLRALTGIDADRLPEEGA